MTWHATDGQRGPGEAHGRVLGRTGGGHVPRVGRPHAHRELSRGARQGVPGHPRELRARRGSWTGPPIRGPRRRTPSRRPGQVTAQGPTLRRGIGRLHFAGEYTSYAFMGYMEGALNSGAAAARRIAQRDGVVKEKVAA